MKDNGWMRFKHFAAIWAHLFAQRFCVFLCMSVLLHLFFFNTDLLPVISRDRSPKEALTLQMRLLQSSLPAPEASEAPELAITALKSRLKPILPSNLKSKSSKNQAGYAQAAIDNAASEMPARSASTLAETVVGAPFDVDSGVPVSMPVQNAVHFSQSAATSTHTSVHEAASSVSPELKFPSSFELNYQVKRMRRAQSTLGWANLNWKSDGLSYDIKLETFVQGAVLSQSSMGKINASGLQPIRYADKRVGRSEQAAHFRYAEPLIRFSNNKPDARLPAGAQDPLSLWVQLMALCAGNADYFAGLEKQKQMVQTPVAGVDRLEVWSLRVLGTQEIQTPAGALQAISLERQARNEYDERLQIWLAPALHCLPVRILSSAYEQPEQEFFEWVLRNLP